MDFREELTDLINTHSRENGSNTPDFILADYLVACLAAFDAASNQRARGYGGKGANDPGPPPTTPCDQAFEKAPARGEAAEGDQP